MESERRRQADILASTVAMKLHLVLVEIRKNAERARNISSHVKAGLAREMDPQPLSNLFLLCARDGLTQLRASVMLFDRDSGILTNTALDMLDGYNPPIESSIAMYEFNGRKPSELASLCETVHERLGDVEELCSAAEARLESVHGLSGPS